MTSHFYTSRLPGGKISCADTAPVMLLGLVILLELVRLLGSVTWLRKKIASGRPLPILQIALSLTYFPHGLC